MVSMTVSKQMPMAMVEPLYLLTTAQRYLMGITTVSLMCWMQTVQQTAKQKVKQTAKNKRPRQQQTGSSQVSVVTLLAALLYRVSLAARIHCCP